MNAPLPQSVPQKDLPAMLVVVKGRIEAVRRYEDKHYTRLITPAADAYSRPQIVEVRSSRRLGSAQEELSQLCKLGGFTRKSYTTKDGEIVTPVDLTLDAVE